MPINFVGSTNSCSIKHEQNIRFRSQARIRRNGHGIVKEEGPDIKGSKVHFLQRFKQRSDISYSMPFRNTAVPLQLPVVHGSGTNKSSS
jgi:hypothetical protein